MAAAWLPLELARAPCSELGAAATPQDGHQGPGGAVRRRGGAAAAGARRRRCVHHPGGCRRQGQPHLGWGAPGPAGAALLLSGRMYLGIPAAVCHGAAPGFPGPLLWPLLPALDLLLVAPSAPGAPRRRPARARARQQLRRPAGESGRLSTNRCVLLPFPRTLTLHMWPLQPAPSTPFLTLSQL